jgi:hypothetical protein
MSPREDITPKITPDPLKQAPQGARVAQSVPVQSPDKPGFVMYEPDYAKYLLQVEAGEMKLPWAIIQSSVHLMLDRLYSKGVIFAKATGSNQEFVQKTLVQGKQRVEIPVRVRSLPGGVKTERA